jgi:hypothetical protein
LEVTLVIEKTKLKEWLPVNQKWLFFLNSKWFSDPLPCCMQKMVAMYIFSKLSSVMDDPFTKSLHNIRKILSPLLTGSGQKSYTSYITGLIKLYPQSRWVKYWWPGSFFSTSIVTLHFCLCLYDIFWNKLKYVI